MAVYICLFSVIISPSKHELLSLPVDEKSADKEKMQKFQFAAAWKLLSRSGSSLGVRDCLLSALASGVTRQPADCNARCFHLVTPRILILPFSQTRSASYCLNWSKAMTAKFSSWQAANRNSSLSIFPAQRNYFAAILLTPAFRGMSLYIKKKKKMFKNIG